MGGGCLLPALSPLAGAHVVPQAAVTYGQADLQQHCLAFIESCTAVRPRGNPKWGHRRAWGANGDTARGSRAVRLGWLAEKRDQMVFRGRMLRDE